MVYENGLSKESQNMFTIEHIEYCNNNLVMDPNWGSCHSN